MTAAPEPAASSPDCTAVVDEFARRLPELDLESLRKLLQVLQHRLGTAAEHPCDLDRTQILGHEIKNRLTAVQLVADLRRLEPPDRGLGLGT